MSVLLRVVVVLALLVVGALVVLDLAFDSTTVKTHVIAGQISEIVVASDSGDVDLVPGGRVVVRETRHFVFDEPQLEQRLDDGVLTLATGCGEVAFNCSTDLQITMPPGLKVSVDADSGDIEARRVAIGDPHMETDSGDVSLALVGEQTLVWAHTDSGDVDVSGPDLRAVDAETDSGDVDIAAGDTPRRIVAETDSGDVDVIVPAGEYAIDAQTDSGDVEVDSAVSRNDRAPRSIDARTDSGDVTIRAR